MLYFVYVDAFLYFTLFDSLAYCYGFSAPPPLLQKIKNLI